MRVFVTGSTGFVGSAIVDQLVQANHQVLGLVRSPESGQKLSRCKIDVHIGNIYDLESLQAGARKCDAVIHTAFNHDFSKFKENCETDRTAILALGEALAGTGKPIVVTSGIGILSQPKTILESDYPPSSDLMPRAATEEAAKAITEKGVNAYIVRLPPTVHGDGDHGFIPMVIGIARQKGRSVYIGSGDNHWPAVHRFDAARVYKLILEKLPTERVFHAVAEHGVPFRLIAEKIGSGLNVPTLSLSKDEAQEHFTWFSHFASMNCPASSAVTKGVLDWSPKEIDLMQDFQTGSYFSRSKSV